ncbi:MAG: response regulator, partial [Chloroflexota bacterium]|nr:response regulator [Chloroflexota bacterium]
VLDSARSLTRARYGVITLSNYGGGLENVLFSGMDEGEVQGFRDMPDGHRFFDYLNGVSGTLRVPDLAGHLRGAGLPEFRPPVAVDARMAFLAAPLLHRGERVGNIYVAEKERGGEFTREDEETLVMFASQGALVLENARRHWDERQARADLETLVNTSPVGVVVFDARTGAPVSFNREALRIVDVLREPDQTHDQLLEVITFRRGDGREISLKEFSMAELLRRPETVRAEEIVLRAPAGPSVTVLLNATPILSEEGEVGSFVVTLQDMTPMEELERLRADFLAMVSHELRAPLTSIKGSVTTLLSAASELDPAEMTQFFRIIDGQVDHIRYLIGDLLDVARIETGTLSVIPGPSDVADMVDEARSRFLVADRRDTVAIDLDPNLPPVMADRRRVVQVLGNLLTNAAMYSPPLSPIRVTAVRQGLDVAIAVADEGRGVSADQLPRLFSRPTRRNQGEQGNGAAGAGLGLAISKGIVESHGGRIWAESAGPGMGARITFTLPSAEEGRKRPAIGHAATRHTPPRGEDPGQVRVLAVDDDPQALRHIRDTLTKEGYAPIVTGDPEDVLRLIERENPQLVLLDMMLPGYDGLALLEDIGETSDVPVIFLSVYGREELVAKAFDAGAVDYVIKPFSPTELAARMRAALRMRAWDEPTMPFVHGDLVVNYVERRVTRGGRPVQLTAIEYRLLRELAMNAGRVLTYENLLRRVWGVTHSGDIRPMRTVISNLRHKLGDDAKEPALILTEPRVGYRMLSGRRGAD